MATFTVAPMRSWQEFLDTARTPPTIDRPAAHDAGDEWCGADWPEALRLAVDGWHRPLLDTSAQVGELRTRSGALGTALEPVLDVTGGEVDVGAYLAGRPECMVDAMPQRTSTRGRVVTFFVPATYSSITPHAAIINRGVALATLSEAIVRAGHAVELWSWYSSIFLHRGRRRRCSAVAKVISAGEPLDVGRLVFALAHPAMLRHLWLAVWNCQEPRSAEALSHACYGIPWFDRAEELLPAEASDAYVLPQLGEDVHQWLTVEQALAWTEHTFSELGLVSRTRC